MSFRVNLQWREPRTKNFRTGVSLHSHTLHSVERLNFIYRAAVHVPVLAAAIRQGERRYAKLHGASLDLSRGWWTPPLGPHDAWIVEKSQIEQLGLDALVSLTDHDDIEAPVLLQLLDECRQVPISVEWTVPFRSTFFHLGIHNLPPWRARALFGQMECYRQKTHPGLLEDILSEICASNGSLVVWNHPLWDESGIGQAMHDANANEFLLTYKEYLHALELNGLRPWRENRDVIAMAAAAAKPPISGGDRHAFEPNALLNLTNAATFAEFADEVRAGWSEVLVLRHYREPYTLRIVQNTIDVLRTYEQHVNGWRLWSDRVFYRCDDGKARSLTELFAKGLPAPVAFFVGTAQLLSGPPFQRVFRGLFPATEEITL
jgi:hypothetical protein